MSEGRTSTIGNVSCVADGIGGVWDGNHCEGSTILDARYTGFFLASMLYTCISMYITNKCHDKCRKPCIAIEVQYRIHEGWKQVQLWRKLLHAIKCAKLGRQDCTCYAVP